MIQDGGSLSCTLCDLQRLVLGLAQGRVGCTQTGNTAAPFDTSSPVRRSETFDAPVPAVLQPWGVELKTFGWGKGGAGRPLAAHA
jgi:hypothetical protein